MMRIAAGTNVVRPMSSAMQPDNCMCVWKFMKKSRLDCIPSKLTSEEARELLDCIDDSDIVANASEALSRLRSAAKINRDLRVKYADTPQKYVESEVDLDDELKSLTLISGDTSSLVSFTENQGMRTLANLLSHDNSDICNSVVLALNEFTSENVLEDLGEFGRSRLISSIKDCNIPVALCNFFLRLPLSKIDEHDNIINRFNNKQTNH
jgi:beta-catenin-like protein 1